MSEEPAPAAHKRPQKRRRATASKPRKGAPKRWWDLVRDRLNENFIYATIIAALILQWADLPEGRRELLPVGALLVISVAVVFWEVWRAREGDYEPGGIVAVIAKRIVGVVTPDTWVQRIAAASVVVAVVGGGMTYMTWRTVEGVLANSYMDGDVNVLVATLHDQDAEDASHSPISRQVSLWLEASLLGEFAAEVEDGTVAIQLVDKVISGSQREAHEQVVDLGEKYAADVVLFGDVLQGPGGGIFVTPRYAFTGRRASDLSGVEVASVTGVSALGEAIGPVDLEASGAELTARSGLIVQFLTGLVSLLQDQPDSSEHFRAAIEAAAEQGLPPNATLQYFLGNALALQHTPDSYEEAKASFETALQIEPGYTRAEIGLANTLYLQATLASLVDQALLAQAAMLFEDALTALESGNSPVLEASARIGLGHVYASLARRDPDAYRTEARRQYAIAASIEGDCDEDGLSWWDPRGWWFWGDRFEKERPECKQLSRLSALAQNLIADLETVIQRPVASPVPTGNALGMGEVSVSSATARLGETTSVRVSVIYDSEPGLGAWEVSLLYDPILLAVQGCRAGLTSGVCNPAYDEVTIRVAGASATGLIGETPIVEVTFECIESGEAALDVRVDVLADATAGGPRPIEAVSSNGAITCVP